jgi:cytochrome c-type biogenesis protein CcmH/NrfG
MSRFTLALALSAGIVSYGQDLKKAESLYQHTDYSGSLQIVQAIKPPNAETYFLMGRDYFGLGRFKQATESFQKAGALGPKNSDYALWLGRTWGRRAEAASPITAPVAAGRARQCFELAVKLDPRNQEAVNDLFDYYLNAPGILGGGLDKAAAVAKHIAELDEAEGHFAEAQLADRRKQFEKAEQQFRRAMQLAPKQVGRVIDLARYLAKRGRVQESDAVFAQAEKIEPGSPKLLYSRAKTYVETKRNLEQARQLLKQYLQSNLTPEDPTREEAQKLLRKASGA